MTHGKTIALACLLALFLGLAVGCNGWLEERRLAAPLITEDEPLYASDATARRVSLAFNGLAADWYWLRTLQYLGSKVLRYRETHPGANLPVDNLSELNPKQLYPLLDRATTMDPNFIAAYEFGGIVLPAVSGDDTVRLLKKGIANNPDAWRLYHHLGFYYWRQQDYEAAGKAYADASRIPGSPVWLQAMSARMKAEGGSYDTARDIYRQLAASADDPNIKRLAELRLLQVHSLEEREAIRKVIQDFRARNGRCPNNWHEINAPLRAVRLTNKQPLYCSADGTPLDPANTPYLLTENGCQADLDKSSLVPYK